MPDWLHSFNDWLVEVGWGLGERLQAALESGSGSAIAIVFVAGLVTSLTPCVYPMIPVTVTFIGGSAGGNRRRAVTLSLVYVLGMALVYTTLGVVSALLGKTFGTLSQSPWINAAVGLLIVGFGLAMLDLFTIKVPTFFGSVQAKGARKGGHVGALFMGIAAGFIAAPCTAPVLAVLLVMVSQQGDALWGGFLLLVFSLGLGFLLMLLGIFSGMLSSLPKAGSWMDWIKKGFGVVMLLIGAFFLWNAVAGFMS